MKVFKRSHSKSSSAFQALFSTETLGGVQISSHFSLEGHVIIKAKSWQGKRDLDGEKKKEKSMKTWTIARYQGKD